MQWFDLPTEHRAGRECASAGCGEQATARLEAGGVGSDYCSDCVAKIDELMLEIVANASATVPPDAYNETQDAYARGERVWPSDGK